MKQQETIELLDSLITGESKLTEEQKRTLLELREQISDKSISKKKFRETWKEIAKWIYYFITEW